MRESSRRAGNTVSCDGSAPMLLKVRRTASSPAGYQIDHPSGVGTPGIDSARLVVDQVASGRVGACKRLVASGRGSASESRWLQTVSGRDCSMKISLLPSRLTSAHRSEEHTSEL